MCLTPLELETNGKEQGEKGDEGVVSRGPKKEIDEAVQCALQST